GAGGGRMVPSRTVKPRSAPDATSTRPAEPPRHDQHDKASIATTEPRTRSRARELVNRTRRTSRREPRTVNPEPRTPNQRTRTPNPEPPTPNPDAIPHPAPTPPSP